MQRIRLIVFSLMVLAMLPLSPTLAAPAASADGSAKALAQFQQAGALAMQGDMRRAVPLLQALNIASLPENRRAVATCMRDRFAALQTPPMPADLDPFAARLLAAYRRYWTRVMLGKQPAADAERELAQTLATQVVLPERAGAAPGMEALEPLLQAKLEARGYHALFGITAPLREFMLWRTQQDKTYEVDLPEGHEAVQVTMMDDFVSLGWLGYAVCDLHHTGGWATPERLFAVRSAYDLDAESFKVSYLAHEGEHFADYRRFPGLAQPELEYRAKLVEIALADTSLASLLRSFAEDAGASRDTPHPWADRQVMAHLGAALLPGRHASADAIAALPPDRVHAAAVALLREDSAMRAKGNVTAPVPELPASAP